VSDLLRSYQGPKRKVPGGSSPQHSTITKRIRKDYSPATETLLDTDFTLTGEHEVETTPFMKFILNLVDSQGVLQWRVHTGELDILSMNDVDLNSNINRTLLESLHSLNIPVVGLGTNATHNRFSVVSKIWHHVP
jgi:hypothetical protein